LRQEKGKQERLATSITDEMYSEAQVSHRRNWLQVLQTRCTLRLR